MADARIGRQTPTKSVAVPYEQTRGAEAVELYNSTVFCAASEPAEVIRSPSTIGRGFLYILSFCESPNAYCKRGRGLL